MIDINELLDLEKLHYSLNSARLPISKQIENYTHMTEEDTIMFSSHGMNKEEAYIYLIFTGHCSGVFNRSLSHPKKEMNPLEKIVVPAFDNILKKLERAKETMVYRMDEEYDRNDVKKWFTAHQGKVIQIPWFLSTSAEEWEDYPVVWRITLLHDDRTTAHPVYKIINHGDETEVRFERNLNLKVGGIQETEKTLYIDLAEEADDAIVSAVLTYTCY